MPEPEFQCQPGSIKAAKFFSVMIVLRTCFNASLVRLKRTPTCRACCLTGRFQCQPGSIKAIAHTLGLSTEKVFQCQPGSIKAIITFRSVYLVSVMFQCQPGSIKALYCNINVDAGNCFNASLVRLKLASQGQIRTRKLTVSMPAWFD